MLKKFNNFNKIEEDFRPNISAQIIWSNKEELRKIILKNLINDNNLTLDDYIKSCKGYVSRLSDEDKKDFNEVVDKLNLPVWQKKRNY